MNRFKELAESLNCSKTSSSKSEFETSKNSISEKVDQSITPHCKSQFETRMFFTWPLRNSSFTDNAVTAVSDKSTSSSAGSYFNANTVLSVIRVDANWKYRTCRNLSSSLAMSSSMSLPESSTENKAENRVKLRIASRETLRCFISTRTTLASGKRPELRNAIRTRCGRYWSDLPTRVSDGS